MSKFWGSRRKGRGCRPLNRYCRGIASNMEEVLVLVANRVADHFITPKFRPLEDQFLRAFYRGIRPMPGRIIYGVV